ncbi:MAG: GNAT family N-acetyltransferase [Acidobacteriaceae bacterium]
MTQALPLDILDLRHFSAADLKPLLDMENKEWSRQLNWNYRTSIEMILHYLDSRVLPGFVATDGKRITGYSFCVYEEAKAVIGDVYAMATSDGRHSAREIEKRLLEHLIEMLQNSPGTERIEAQLLLHPSGSLSSVFRASGFEIFRRSFMQLDLTGYKPMLLEQAPPGLRMRPWNEADFTPAAHLIAGAYAGHLDSRINDQYQSIAGSMRFLHNIIRFPGCGLFDPAASRVLVQDKTGALKGVLLCSQVKEDVAHITQICVAPECQGHGLGGLMIEDCAGYLHKRRFRDVTLTVTQQNVGAVRLYEHLGFSRLRTFDAMLWVRPPFSLSRMIEQEGAV